MFKKIHDAKDLEALLRAWHGKRAAKYFLLTGRYIFVYDKTMCSDAI